MMKWLLRISILVCLLLALAVPGQPVNAESRYFASPGGSGTSCSKSTPCSLQTAAGFAAAGDWIYLESGTYTAASPTDDEVLYLDQPVLVQGACDYSVAGQYPDCGGTNSPSFITGQATQRVVTIIGDGISDLHFIINDVEIYYGDASGINLADCDSHITGNVLGCGGGMYVDNIDYLELHRVRFQENLASTTATTSDISLGGGLYLRRTDNVSIEDSEFSFNMAGDQGAGLGGGIYAFGDGSNLLGVYRTTFSANDSSSNNSGGMGAAVAVYNYDSVYLQESQFLNNNLGNRLIAGGAAYLEEIKSSCIVSDNIFQHNRGSSVVSVAAYDNQEGAAIYRNQFLSDWALTAIAFSGEFDARIHNNFISMGVSSRLARGAMAYGISMNGASGGSDSALRIYHNSIAYVDRAIVIDSYVYTFIEANIIAYSFSDGIYLTPAGVNASAMPDTNLFYQNANNGDTGTDPVFGDPKFVDGLNGDLHIQDGSAAIDQSDLVFSFETEIDQDPRPIGGGPTPYDLGADERTLTMFYLPLLMR